MAPAASRIETASAGRVRARPRCKSSQLNSAGSERAGPEFAVCAATNNVGARSPYAPLTGRREVPLERPVIYDVGPWGLPVLWHPLNNFW